MTFAKFASVALLLSVTGLVLAQPDLDKKSPPEAQSDIPHDKAFDPHVDLKLLPDAIANTDASLVTDVALLLAEGERILKRPHQGIRPEQLLRLAARMAADTKDVATLDRLAQAAKARKDADLELEVTLARKLAAVPRKASTPATFTEAQIESGIYGIYKSYVRQIDQARAIGDRTTLELLESGLGTGKDLGENLDKHLRGAIKESLAGLPEKASPEAELAAKLLGGARSAETIVEADNSANVAGSFLTGGGSTGTLGSSWYTINPTLRKFVYANPNGVETSPGKSRLIVNYCRAALGRKIGTGECAELNQYAVNTANYNLQHKSSYGPTSTNQNYRRILPSWSFGPKTSDGDYVWGNLVTTLEPKKINFKTIAATIKPGDLLQFKKAIFMPRSYVYNKKTYRPDGWLCKHHSAVVLAVMGEDFVNVFEQKVDGKLYVLHNVYRLSDMTAGKVWVYRAK